MGNLHLRAAISALKNNKPKRASSYSLLGSLTLDLSANTIIKPVDVLAAVASVV